MATTYPTNVSSVDSPLSEGHVVHTTHLTLKYAFGLLAIIAGADKFTNFITVWEQYLNPALLNIVPLTAVRFMHIVGAIEIIAGALVLLRPRIGAFVVMAWLLGIALQLLVWGRFLDIAVRDIVMALSALVLARLTPFAQAHRRAFHASHQP